MPPLSGRSAAIRKSALRPAPGKPVPLPSDGPVQPEPPWQTNPLWGAFPPGKVSLIALKRPLHHKPPIPSTSFKRRKWTNPGGGQAATWPLRKSLWTQLTEGLLLCSPLSGQEGQLPALTWVTLADDPPPKVSVYPR